jgi:predicted nucleic acid-binding protein
MKHIWGYSNFYNLLKKQESLKTGLIVDTNVLISATYEPDLLHDDTIEFLDLVMEQQIPLYCNVNVKSEFLEIHRRIIFTEALLDLEKIVDKQNDPPQLVKKLISLNTQNEKRKKQTGVPLRLSEADLKTFKLILGSIENNKGNLLTTFCQDRISGKLSAVWQALEEGFGLTFLSLRKGDHDKHFSEGPSWKDAVALMELPGLSSSDAMIINIFMKSKFSAIITSDLEVAHAVSRLSAEGGSKIALVPDKLVGS